MPFGSMHVGRCNPPSFILPQLLSTPCTLDSTLATTTHAHARSVVDSTPRTLTRTTTPGTHASLTTTTRTHKTHGEMTTTTMRAYTHDASLSIQCRARTMHKNDMHNKPHGETTTTCAYTYDVSRCRLDAARTHTHLHGRRRRQCPHMRV